jgi:cell wall-associated NlpC family hydrolase
VKDKTIVKNNIHKERIAVVKKAKQMLGAPYVWGGESRGGADCSGLTRFAYKAANIFLPHYAYAQMQLGKWVKGKFLRPGDLLFYHNGGHVALYIGNGRMIHASSYYGQIINAPLRGGWGEARRILYS